MRHWLFKTEPSAYSIDDLRRDTKTSWTGVRNYQARNMLRDEVKKGDVVLFYHSSCAVPGVVGVAEVTKEGFPDETQFDSKSEYFDAAAKKENPRWFAVEVKFVKKFTREVSLAETKKEKSLQGLHLLMPGNRLSLFPVSEKHFYTILTLGHTSLQNVIKKSSV